MRALVNDLADVLDSSTLKSPIFFFVKSCEFISYLTTGKLRYAP